VLFYGTRDPQLETRLWPARLRRGFQEGDHAYGAEEGGHSGPKWSIRALLLTCITVSLRATASPQSYQNTPFDLATKTLPAGFRGYGPEAYINGYQDATLKDERVRQKDQFETTAEYQEPLKGLSTENPFITNLYAFSLSSTGVSYDADREMFALSFEPEPAPGNVNYLSVTLDVAFKGQGHYDAEDGFGAVFTV
jgi:hypothetical protein